MKKNIPTKNKIINFLTLKGEKTSSEKHFIKSVKQLQKTTKKTAKDVIQSSIISATTPFKILIFRQKKQKKKKIREVPFFFKTQESRKSFAIKNLIEIATAQTKIPLFERLKSVFITTTRKPSDFLKKKEEIFKLLTAKKKLLTFFRW